MGGWRNGASGGHGLALLEGETRNSPPAIFVPVSAGGSVQWAQIMTRRTIPNEPTSDFEPLSPITLRNDQPIDPGHNRPDRLNFTPLARTVAGIAIGTEGPFTVGVTAKWGHGKTSMLRLIKHLIEQHGQTKGAEWQATHVNVWFNAWQYEGEEQPIVPLLLAIQRAIAKTEEEHRSRREKAGATAIGWLDGIWAVFYAVLYGLKLKVPAGTPLAGIDLDYSKIIDKYEKESGGDPETTLPVSTIMQVVDALDTMSEAREDQLTEDPEDKPKIVVFIDDLDRCHPDTATKLLDGIKLILNQPGFIFILALDKTIIEEYLIHRYEMEFGNTSSIEVGSKYIEKIIQLEVPIPPASELSSSETESYLHALCEEILDGLPHEKLPKILRYFDTMSPRDAARFLLRTRAEYEAWVYRGKPKCKLHRPPDEQSARGGKKVLEEITEAQVLEGLLLLDLLEAAFPAAGKQRFVDLCAGPALCEFMGKVCEPHGIPAISDVDHELARTTTPTELTRAIYNAVSESRGLREAFRDHGGVLMSNLAMRRLLRTGHTDFTMGAAGSVTSTRSNTIIREAVRLALGLEEKDWTDGAWRQVTRLDLSGQRDLTDCDLLAQCSKLSMLNLGGTQVSNVSSLLAIETLQILHLHYTNVSDAPSLSGLKSLKFLDLTGTNITRKTVDSLRTSLPNCRILR